MDVVEKYKRRRAERLASRTVINYDSVEAFKTRRAMRLRERVDADFNESDHPRAKDGKFTSGSGSAGGSANGKTSGKKEKKTAGEKSPDKSPKVKGVTMAKSELGFDVPTFDEATFTENMEEKKAIARKAAKDLIPGIKKSLSTDIHEIKRPEVNEATRKYIQDTVKDATPEQIEKGLEEADKLYRYWEEHEPAVTEAVVGAVKKAGGSMFGLDNRLKFDKSLAKKAVADAINPELKYKGDVSKAATDIKDGCRYTAVFDDDNFTEGYNAIKSALEKMGIREYRCKNFWTQYRDQDGSHGKKIGEQKAVQSVFEMPDGQKIELQFHTPSSMAAKEVNHSTYKQKKEPPSQYKEYNDPRSLFMRDTSSVVADPKGVFDIEEHRRGEKGYK